VVVVARPFHNRFFGFGLGTGFGLFGWGSPWFGWGPSWFGWGSPWFGWGSPWIGDDYFSPSWDFPDFSPAYTATPGVDQNQAFLNGQPAGRPEQGVATIQVVVPAEDAEVFFDGTPTRQRGRQRVFQTPVIAPGQEFTYTVTATWTENGQAMRGEDRVTVRPGSGTLVNFTSGPR
jgi:uncharacterized protein (TIGR03000 family)